MKEKKEKKEKKLGFFARRKLKKEEETKAKEEETPIVVEEVLEENKLEPVDYYEFMETASKKMDNHKARVAGSWGEKRAARMIRDDSTTLLGIPSRMEPFYSRKLKGRPCFLLIGIVYAICFGLFLLSYVGAVGGAGIVVGNILAVISLVGIVLAVAFLLPLYMGFPFAQKLLKRGVSYNVLSTVEPKVKENVKNIVIASNYDSKYGNNFKMRDKTRFWIITLSLFSILAFALLDIIRLAVGVNTTAKIASLIVLAILFALPSSFALIFTFSLSNDKIEENNGYATAVALTTLRYLIDEKLIPADARISVVSLGGENAGHDGAKAFVKNHKDILDNATVINIGDILERKYFVATEDSVRKHTFDIDLKDIALSSAEENDIDLVEEGKTFGALEGYAATEFEKAGARAVTIFAQDKDPFRDITEENEDIQDVVKNCFNLTIGIAKKVLEEK